MKLTGTTTAKEDTFADAGSAPDRRRQRQDRVAAKYQQLVRPHVPIIAHRPFHYRCDPLVKGVRAEVACLCSRLTLKTKSIWQSLVNSENGQLPWIQATSPKEGCGQPKAWAID